MKKSLVIVALFNVVIMAFGQHKVADKISELENSRTIFKSVSVLSPKQNSKNADVEKVVDGATLATLDITKVNEVIASHYEYIELELPYQNQTITALLYRVNPLAYGFHVDTDKGKNIPYEQGIYYRGILKDQHNSVVAFNFFNGECSGILSSSALGNLVVGKLDKPNNQLDYIVYSDAKMKVLDNSDCHVKEEGYTVKTSNNINRNTNSDRCVTMYFEVDNNLYANNNSNTTTTTNWMTSVFNNVQTLYENDGISVALKSIFIWTEPDPYQTAGNTSAAHLQAFNAFRPVFDGDVGQQVGIDPGGLGGVAITINGLCSQNNYSYSDIDFSYLTVPTYSWTIQVITHEFGHLLGSPHTHGCYWNGDNTVIDGCGQQAGYHEGDCAQGPIPAPEEKGTIMSYCHLISGVGISFNNGFGPQPTDAILSSVNGGSCLSLDCINTCINTVVDIATYNITPTTAEIYWTDDANSSWEVSVTPFSSTSIIWQVVNTPSYSASGLSPNAYYKIRVRPVCSPDVTSSDREAVFATTVDNFCAGVPFTDTGGTTGNYTDLQNWVRTMTPYNSGLKLKVSFSSFNLEQNFDYLYIYNGPNEFSNDLTLGGLTGAAIPSSFNSTSSEGSLTFKFVSDQEVTAAGWNASITCTGTLGEETNDFLDFSYYPNPTKGNVSISSKDVITEIRVYNVEGRLLFTKKVNELRTNVDISQFATGTYFFKLKFNEREANFKILKMN